jgi:hypothetical protein
MFTSKKKRILFATGLFCMSASFIVSHVLHLNDFFDGLLKGVGLGLMLFSFPYKKKIRTAN